MKLTIDEIRERGWVAYEYRRGSHAYHLNTETSDEDFGGVFLCPREQVYGLRSNYVEQVSDERHDVVFHELGRWVELLLKSNPTALEGLFVPEDCIIGRIHPAVRMFIDNRDMFLSKECFRSFYGYAVSQIGKARGLSKKIVNPVTERKDILDFCFTFKDQGSQPMKEFLAEMRLDQRYCGLVGIPSMKDTYGVYYDFAAFFAHEGIGWEKALQAGKEPYCRFLSGPGQAEEVGRRIGGREYFGYGGIVHPEELFRSNGVRLSSIPKGESPICFMTFNKDAYAGHCREYREYKEWESMRNPVRYESNLGHNYDAKNVMHCMRLIRMAKEIALGQGFNLARTYDREYLLDIRNHRYEYEEVMAQLEKEKAEMAEAIRTCTLRETVDAEAVNRMLIAARESYYG